MGSGRAGGQDYDRKSLLPKISVVHPCKVLECTYIATEVGLRRDAQLLSMTVPEVMNRAIITGGIEIGRLPSVVQITFRAPLTALEKAGLLPFVREQYGIG